ncbi:MAG TPA: response regulator, partial [Nitrospirae bacterium]|nr:response regulator [Nitrospirota bacterium]
MKTKHSILLVDDDSSVRDVLASILGEEGFKVVDTGSPEEAERLISDRRFHLVLSDIKMPRISGITLLKKIKEIDSDIPVILITGFPELDLSIEALKEGAYDFIIKPFKVAYVIHSVKKA